jgi:glycosyltransferase involved in cell wall biosynthesis
MFSEALSESGLEVSCGFLWEANEMRVLHLGKFFYPYRGGIENFLRDLALELNRNGIRSSILAHHERPFKRSQSASLDGLEIIKTFSLGQMVYAPMAPSFGHHLSRVMRRFKPDILHIHVPNLSAFFVLAAQKRPPYVVHWHADVVPSRLDRRLRLFYPPYLLFERALLKNAKAIIATSASYLEASPPLAPFRHKCHVVPLGLNPARLRPLLRKGDSLPAAPSAHRFTVLSAGRFAYYKGIQFLIEAAQQVPGARFILAGEGPLRKRMMEQVALLGLADRVFLPGLLADEELHALFACCDLFCLPSIERTEAFGLVLLEAMAFGKALVTTAIGGSGMNWVNQNGITGLVVKPRDGHALAQAIKRLMREPELRKTMGHEAEKRFAEHFHIREVTQKIISVYSTCQTSSSG